jgi:hypothetical protein
MIRRLLFLLVPLALAVGLGGCVVAPAPGYYGRPAYSGVYVAPRPYYRPYYYRPYGYRRW